ncbi:glycosyltransferase family 2 protein [Shewanella sp. VB17]|uniref:glycosyltransferase family 2 protein n=1 Tax=Shewanella sp. VB17 TaxID=2739432 RepID=UPI0015673E11|nr:glycosyltransferase [Shewanella sp. VB17]NRD74702.1 glycosyltransferase family 2 protein [Shewanella sp. VB17]
MPLISFIVPTHNRFKYAVKTIASLLSISKDIEIVISDTSNNNLLDNYCHTHKDKNQIKLVKPGEGLSVVDNFNYGLKNASGEFLVFLGDDDFVTDNVIDVANWANDNCVESVRFSFPVTYFWPDFKHRHKGNVFSGTLNIAEYTGLVVKHDTKKALDEALNDFGRGVLNMPRAYSGMISRKLAERIITKYGKLFGGVSPDIYSSTLISYESLSSYLIDYPIVVPGASGVSTSGLSAKGKHTGKLRDNPHIGAFKNLVWDERIPEFYSVPTVWSYSFLKALEQIDVKQNDINYSILYLRCFIYYPQYRKLTFDSVKFLSKNNGYLPLLFNVIKSLFKEMSWVFSVLLKRVVNKLSSSNVRILNDVNDVVEAKVKCEADISKNKKIINYPNMVK